MDGAKDREQAFILAHTALALVPFVPEISLYTATAVTPLWQATETWLEARNVAIPFWSVPWAGGQALARHVLDHPEVVAGLRVLDFACGGGIVAIAAARSGAASVIAVDIDPLAIAATSLNAEANRVRIETRCEDIVDGDLSAFDIVLTGDIFYERAAAERFTRWLSSLSVPVLAADPARHYVPEARELARYEVPTSIELESVPSRPTRILALTKPK